MIEIKTEIIETLIEMETNHLIEIITMVKEHNMIKIIMVKGLETEIIIKIMETDLIIEIIKEITNLIIIADLEIMVIEDQWMKEVSRKTLKILWLLKQLKKSQLENTIKQ